MGTAARHMIGGSQDSGKAAIAGAAKEPSLQSLMTAQPAALAPSVVIPTYNASGYIRHTLASVLHQTQPPAEVVVVDDCSTDDTVDIVRAVEQQSPIPFQVIRLKENSGGPCRPLNVGIRQARSNMICVLEQDDLMTPRRIEVQIAALQTYPDAALAIGRYEVRNVDSIDELPTVYSRPQFETLALTPQEQNAPSVQISGGRAFGALLQHNFTISNSNFCFPRATWKALGGFDESIATVADLDFALRAMTVGPMAIVNELTLLYNFRPNSLNRSDEERVSFEGTWVRLRAIAKRPGWGRDYVLSRQPAIHRFWQKCRQRRHYRALLCLAKIRLIAAQWKLQARLTT